MSDPPLVFLDANVVFSAALGGPAFELLLELAGSGRLRLTTSRACVVEAETNLERKRPDMRGALASVLRGVSVQAWDESEDTEWAATSVDHDDVHVLAAARASGADVLLTGDTTHFGRLTERDDLGLRVRTPRAFLLESPA